MHLKSGIIVFLQMSFQAKQAFDMFLYPHCMCASLLGLPMPCICKILNTRHATCVGCTHAYLHIVVYKHMIKSLGFWVAILKLLGAAMWSWGCKLLHLKCDIFKPMGLCCCQLLALFALLCCNCQLIILQA